MKKFILILLLNSFLYANSGTISGKVTHMSYFPNFQTITINFKGEIKHADKLIKLLDSLIAANNPEITDKFIEYNESNKNIKQIKYHFSFFDKYDTNSIPKMKELFKTWKAEVIEVYAPHLLMGNNLKVQVVVKVYAHQSTFFEIINRPFFILFSLLFVLIAVIICIILFRKIANKHFKLKNILRPTHTASR
jgi:hypothetical protein